MRNTLILAAIAAMAFTSVAEAKACKDAKGHFTKCPAAEALVAKTAPNKAGPGTCKDAKGHFAKCGSVAAIPAAPAKPMGGLFGNKTPAASPMAAATGGAPHCKKGKPCGKSCIAMDKVCHK
jgi:hypothetical protein